MPTPEELTPEERLRLQNELTKAELEDTHGAAFGMATDNPDFTPAAEAEFLARIKAMEAGGRDSYVPIGSLIPRGPLKRAAAKAKQRKFQEAADLVVEAAAQAGVITQQPEWIAPQGWYLFLTRDFLEHTIPAPPPASERIDRSSGTQQMVGVLYDQVRQDSPEFLLVASEGFLQDLLQPDTPFEGRWLAHTCRDGADVVPREQAREKIAAWKKQWREIVPVGFAPGGLLDGTQTDGLYFQFNCAYTVTDQRGNTEEYDGPGVVQLALEDKTFKVVGCMLEGFEM